MCTDKAAEMMNINGSITSDVIDQFTRKNVPVLTLHSSYFISDKHFGELRTVMNAVLINAPF